MGILFFAGDVRQPSVLWMRRMLAGLEGDIARLVTEQPLGEAWNTRYPCAVVPRDAGAFVQAAMRRLSLKKRRVASKAQTNWLAKQIASPQVSAVLVHYATLALTYEHAWAQTTKPVFVHCHGYDVTWNLRSHEHPERPVHSDDYRKRVQQLAKSVNFIANSHMTRQRLLEIGVPSARIHVKYLGVPVPSAPRVRQTTSNAGDLNILYLGRLVDFKGPDFTIQAFDIACQQGLQGRLIIAGDGPLRSTCEELRAKSSFAERIELLGAVDETTSERLRTQADIFTAHNCTGRFTQQEEAFGVSIVEAMADALPIVSGANGSLPELIDDGVHGLLFPPCDIAAQAAAFLKLASDVGLREQLGLHAWERARDRFTIQHEMTRLRRLLQLPMQQEPAA